MMDVFARSSCVHDYYPIHDLARTLAPIIARIGSVLRNCQPIDIRMVETHLEAHANARQMRVESLGDQRYT